MISMIGVRVAGASIAFCVCAPIVQASLSLGPSTIEAYASGNTVADEKQNIAGSGDYSQSASAATGGTGSWSGFWEWTGTAWRWQWVFSGAASEMNTASYALAVATDNGLSITGSASAIQADGFAAGDVFVSLNSAFSVTGTAEVSSLSATLNGSGSNISLIDTTTSQTLFASSSTFLPTSISLPAGDQFLLEYNTTSTFPGSDSFNFATVPEPAGTGTIFCCAALFVGRRRKVRFRFAAFVPRRNSCA